MKKLQESIGRTIPNKKRKRYNSRKRRHKRLIFIKRRKKSLKKKSRKNKTPINQNKTHKLRVNPSLSLLRSRNSIPYTRVFSYHIKSSAYRVTRRTFVSKQSKKKARSSLNNKILKDLR